ncbi:MAG: S-layer homology domain-containing protein [Microcoleaceae cyanobacterium]
MSPGYSQESAESKSHFIDIQGHWAQTCLEELEQQNIIDGDFEISRFRPDDPINRVELAILLNSAFPKLESIRDALKFADIPSDYWAGDAIQSAYQKGFLSSYIAGVFNPMLEVSRLQVIVALTQGLGVKSQALVDDAQLSSIFEDVSEIPQEYKTVILAATENWFIVSYPNVRRLNPNKTATRAEVAAFLCQAIPSIQKIQLIPAQYIARLPSSSPSPTSQQSNSIPPNSKLTPIQPTSPALLKQDNKVFPSSGVKSRTTAEALAETLIEPDVLAAEMVVTDKVEAELFYLFQDQADDVREVRLKITRRTKVRFDEVILLVPDQADQNSAQILELKVKDLDNDQEDEVILDIRIFDQRQQALSYSLIYRYSPIRQTYVPSQQFL